MDKNIEPKPCPFCGNKVREVITPMGITMYECTYERCLAIVSFGGNKRTRNGLAYEAKCPRDNWNRRADNAD